jgi:hypothetical protein
MYIFYVYKYFSLCFTGNEDIVVLLIDIIFVSWVK